MLRETFDIRAKVYGKVTSGLQAYNTCRESLRQECLPWRPLDSLCLGEDERGQQGYNTRDELVTRESRDWSQPSVTETLTLTCIL